MTSWQLVGLAGANGDDARREFALRYECFARRVLAKRWRGTSFAMFFDDAVQEVFVECFKSHGVIEKADPTRNSSFRSLLFQVIIHVASRFEHSGRNHRTLHIGQDLTEFLQVDDQSGYESVTREEVNELVREALRRMANHENDDIRRWATLLDRHACHDETIISMASHDTEVAAKLHREYAKAKKECRATLVDVVASEYRVPIAEAKVLVADLLTTFS